MSSKRFITILYVMQQSCGAENISFSSGSGSGAANTNCGSSSRPGSADSFIRYIKDYLFRLKHWYWYSLHGLMHFLPFVAIFFLLQMARKDSIVLSQLYLEPVLGIHDMLVWIWVRGSMSLTNGSGSRSFCFRHYR